MKLNNKKAYRFIDNYIKNTYKKINVESGTCRYNFRCHMNSVHDAIKSGEKEIAMVMCINNRETFIHFINYNEGKYTDNTLGVWVDSYDVYLVRHIAEKEFREINHVFEEYIVYLKNKLPWWLRITSNIDI